MREFISESTYFGLAVTLIIWQLALMLQKKTRSAFLHPILVSAIAIILVLLALKVPNAVYQKGTQVLTCLITPATVCLALPLYEQLKVLKANLPAIIAGVVSGTVVSLVSIWLLGKLFRLDLTMIISLLPKSVTTAIGAPVSESLGGISSVTVAVIIITGILGNICGSLACRLFKITDPIAQGVAIGTSSHVVGTTRANEMGAVQGAVSSLSLVIAGVLTSFLAPLFLQL